MGAQLKNPPPWKQTISGREWVVEVEEGGVEAEPEVVGGVGGGGAVVVVGFGRRRGFGVKEVQ